LLSLSTASHIGIDARSEIKFQAIHVPLCDFSDVPGKHPIYKDNSQAVRQVPCFIDSRVLRKPCTFCDTSQNLHGADQNQAFGDSIKFPPDEAFPVETFNPILA
jgi:hypothetical protein